MNKALSINSVLVNLIYFLCIVPANALPSASSSALAQAMSAQTFSVQYTRSRSSHPKNIKISLGRQDTEPKDWQLIQISDREAQEFRCDKFILIKITTTSSNNSSKVIEYKTECKARYAVVWNQKEKYWDIVKLSEV